MSSTSPVQSPESAGAPEANTAFAPFKVRSFRFQWPADLATSWAFEMETIILGWYVLVETKSVLMLTFFAALQFIGTLLAPMFGVMGDRLGHRNVMAAMRAFYSLLSTTLMTCAFLHILTPYVVLVIATLLGLVRPSDIGMRNALIGETMPENQLMAAMGIQRTTQDSARVAGALTGAGLVAAIGMAWAYVAVASLYAMAFVLTFKAGEGSQHKRLGPPQQSSPWRELKEGMIYVANERHLFGAMLLAVLLNMTAFPLFNSLLPVVAKEVFAGDQRLLGFMVASGAFGALLGSIWISRNGRVFAPGRMMVVCSFLWYAGLIAFAHAPGPGVGMVILFFCGVAQTAGLIPMTAILLRHVDPQYRGRVMGIRMLAIYGNLPGLLVSGPLIASHGYPYVATLYCVVGILAALLITVHWKQDLWTADAMANRK